MTDEQINAAIAEACGWKGCTECNEPICEDNFIPNYSKNLNAMHEAEKLFNYEQCEAFSNKIADIVHAANREKDYPVPWHFARIHATARERAEAFLRTLGKWEEAE
jgi:pterin-4a-carbinolamine dehydratase